jgi:hypothetical protein
MEFVICFIGEIGLVGVGWLVWLRMRTSGGLLRTVMNLQVP